MPVKSSDETLIIPKLPSTNELEAATAAPSELPPPPEPLDAPWLGTLAWAFPTVLMAVLGLIGVGTPALWEDELATWGMVTAPWSDFWLVLQHIDGTIGPYYLLLRGWTEIAGSSDVALRIPSVLALAGAAGLLSAVGTRLGGLRVGIAAGTLFAVLPINSRYAQEARPYALTVLAAVLATFLLLRLLERPNWRRYAGYTLAVILLGLSHVVALLLLGAHALIVWRMRERSRTLYGWFAATLIGLLPALPLLYLGREQTGAQISWIPRVTLQRVADTPATLFGGAVLAGAVLALAFVAMTMRKPGLVATVWAIVPAAGLYAASEITPMWIPRYLLFTLPGWVLLGAMTLRRSSLLRGIGAVLAIGLLALPMQLDIRRPVGHQQGTRDIAAVLRVHSQPGDVLVFGSFANGDQRTSRDAVMRYVPASWRPADPLLKRPPRSDGQLGGQECPEREVPTCLGKPPRVWLVRKGTLADPLSGAGTAKEVLLRGSYTIQQTWSVKGFTIALLTRKPEK